MQVLRGCLCCRQYVSSLRGRLREEAVRSLAFDMRKFKLEGEHTVERELGFGTSHAKDHPFAELQIFLRKEQRREEERTRALLQSQTREIASTRVVDEEGWAWGLGKRKAATAYVKIRPGTGEITINNQNMGDYLKTMHYRGHVLLPLEVVDVLTKVDVVAQVRDGGASGQSQAIRQGLARALVSYNPSYREALADHIYDTKLGLNLLQSDQRRKEPKKPGLLSARKRKAWVRR